MRMEFAAYIANGDGPHWFSVMKAVLNMIGPPVGDPQPPVLPLAADQRPEFVRILHELGYQLRQN
jgi:hypothetical protein